MPVAFDLSAFAGKQVEVIVSYVTDLFIGGTGALVDDTGLVTSAGVAEAEGFEAGLGVVVGARCAGRQPRQHRGLGAHARPRWPHRWP